MDTKKNNIPTSRPLDDRLAVCPVCKWEGTILECLTSLTSTTDQANLCPQCFTGVSIFKEEEAA